MSVPTGLFSGTPIDSQQAPAAGPSPPLLAHQQVADRHALRLPGAAHDHVRRPRARRRRSRASSRLARAVRGWRAPAPSDAAGQAPAWRFHPSRSSPHNVQIHWTANAVPRRSPRPPGSLCPVLAVAARPRTNKAESPRCVNRQSWCPFAKSGLFPEPVRNGAARRSAFAPLAEGPRLVLVAAGRHRAPAAGAVPRLVVERPPAVRSGARLQPVPGAVGGGPGHDRPAAAPARRRCPSRAGVSARRAVAGEAWPAARRGRRRARAASTASWSRSPPLWVYSTARSPSRTSRARSQVGVGDLARSGSARSRSAIQSRSASGEVSVLGVLVQLDGVHELLDEPQWLGRSLIGCRIRGS